MKLDSLNVDSFESMGTVDGPGVRFVVFTKGCPLRCKYCHNPETWASTETNYVPLNDIVKQVLSVKAFMNGGAITISGGEPLLQIDSLVELFKMLKKEGVHTCIDTSGYVELSDKLDELISLTDLFLVDIKNLNDDKCIELTSKSNVKTLNFIKHLESLKKDYWIRHVLMPNTPKEDLEELRAYLDTLNYVKKVEVLPYHTLGVAKYDNLGLEYKLKGVNPPTKEEIELARNILC